VGYHYIREPYYLAVYDIIVSQFLNIQYSVDAPITRCAALLAVGQNDVNPRLSHQIISKKIVT